MPVTQQSVGMIASAVDRIYELTMDTSIRSRYPAARLVDVMQESWAEVLNDLYASAENPPLARVDVSLADGQEYYALPPNVGEIRRVAKFNPDTGLAEWELVNQNLLNPFGNGISFEGGQRFRINPTPTGAETVTVEYIPSGDVLLSSGTCRASDATASTIVLEDDGVVGPQLGAIDRRPNAYVGSYVALLGCQQANAAPSGYGVFPIQERIVNSYSVATGTLTVKPDFDFNPSTETALTSEEGNGLYLLYETYPIEAAFVWPVITRFVARQLLGVDAKGTKFRIMTQLYEEAKQAVIRKWATWQTRSPKHFAMDTADNMEYANVW